MSVVLPESCCNLIISSARFPRQLPSFEVDRSARSKIFTTSEASIWKTLAIWSVGIPIMPREVKKSGEKTMLRLVGSWNLPTFLQGLIYYIPGGWPWGFLNHQQYEKCGVVTRDLWFLLQKTSANTKANGKDVALQIQSWDILLPQVNDFTCGAKGTNKIPFIRNAAMIWLTSLNEIGLRMLHNVWKTRPQVGTRKSKA